MLLLGELRPRLYLDSLDLLAPALVENDVTSPTTLCALTTRSEHWVVVSGTARVTCGDHQRIVNSNESTFIPIASCRRLENPGVIPLVIIEV